jgi:glycosyltransferase involved in cell wall biosynthesis
MHCPSLPAVEEWSNNVVSGEGRPVRILHVLGAMNWGGIETWLIHVLRHIDRQRFCMDFLVEFAEPSPHGDEIRALGSKVIRGGAARGFWRAWWYARNLKAILRQHGPYDVIHSHVHHASGYILRLARQGGVPVRLAHSHIETSLLRASAGLVWRRYVALMTWWISRQATVGLAASREAAVDLFGPAWHDDARWRIHHCGLDLTPFANRLDRRTVRAELGFTPDAFVVGHVGRFVPQKNHTFLVDIVSEAARRDPQVRLLLVGDGPLRPAIEQQVARAGLAPRVVFAGPRRDVPRLMLGAMDTLLFPSLFEGLGLVLVEAQAAGLRCIVASNVPEEADLVRPLVYRRCLSQSATAWADTILTIKQAGAPVSQLDALKLIERSGFNIRTEVSELERLYDTCVRGAYSDTLGRQHKAVRWGTKLGFGSPTRH